MPLPSRTLHVPAALPIDESTRPELLPIGQANLQNRNVRNVERGALEKRLGTLSFPTTTFDGGDITAGRRVFSAPPLANAPCVVDGERLWVYSNSAWIDAGRVPEATYSLFPVLTPLPSCQVYDSATCQGMVAVTYSDGIDGRYLVAVTDAITGAVVSPAQYLDAVETGVALVAATSGFFFVVANYSGGLRVWTFDVANPSTGWVSLGDLIPTVATSAFSICTVSTTEIAVASTSGSGTSRVDVTRISDGGVTGTATVYTFSVTPDGVSIDATIGDTIWVAFISGSAALVGALDAVSLATVGTPTSLASAGGSVAAYIGVCAGPSRTGRVWIAGTNSGDLQMSASKLVVSGGLVLGSAYQVLVHNVHPASRPFYKDGRYYTVVSSGGPGSGDDANTQGLAILVDWTEGGDTTTGSLMRPVANIEPGLIYWHNVHSKVSVLQTAGGPDPERYLYVTQALKTGALPDPITTTIRGTSGATGVLFSFESRDRWKDVAHGAVTALSGGLVTTFDGARVAELGFLARPPKPTTTNAGTGITGTYRYVAVYEDVDASGNLTVSGISDPSDAVTVTNKTITVKTRPIAVTSRITDDSALQALQVAFYRTNQTGEPPYYRLANVTAYADVAAVTYADAVDDAQLTTRGKLYAPQLPGAVGESLDRRAPSQLLHLVSYNGMLVGAKGSSLFWSGQEVYGEATWFSPVFELPISGGGDITGLAVQDGAIVVFKRDRIFVVAGQSPSDNGAQGGLGEARLVSSDWGCIDANSIVVTQIGTFFQSARGIEIFTRSLSVEWIGEPIVNTLASYPYVTSAVVDGRNSLVRFTLASGVTDAVVDDPIIITDPPDSEDPIDHSSVTGGGRDIIFDLSMRAWVSVDDRADYSAAQHATYLNLYSAESRYAWLGSNGVIHLERSKGTNRECRDDNSFVTSQFTTPPLAFGLQQEQRVFEAELTFEKLSPADIIVEVAENYGEFGVETVDKVWLDADVSDVSMVPFRTKSHGHAVQFRIRDREAGSDLNDSGRGVTFVGLSSDAAPKQGSTRGTTRGSTELRR